MIASALLALALTQAYYTPQEAEGIFSQALDAYARQDLPAARQSFEKLIEHGYGEADVLYNAGTVALAEGDLGRAVLYLERARKAGGRSEDLEANLAIARSKQLDQVIGAEASDPFHQRLAQAVSPGVTGWGFLGAWVAAFGFLIASRLLPPGRRRRALVAAGLCFGLAVPAGALVAVQAYVRGVVREAVVVAGTLRARELPKDGARVAFEVHAGLKVRLMESSGRHVRIRLPNGLEGWTEREGVSEL